MRIFYRRPRTSLLLACLIPPAALAGLWLLITRLLTPPVPGGNTPADQVAQFIMHQRGLPRLNRAEREAFLGQQIGRLIQDGRFRERFAAEYRVSSPEEQKAFREHLFDAFKPIVMDDVRAYHALEATLRQQYLDERIVAYNRLSKLLSQVQVDRAALGSGVPSQSELLAILMERTTEQERDLATAYIQALAERVAEILANPDLKKRIEARIEAIEPEASGQAPRSRTTD